MQDAIKQKIEKRAYQLFLKRGGIHGYAMEDWSQAEKEILTELNAGKKAEVITPAPAAKPTIKEVVAEPKSEKKVEAKPVKPAQKPAAKKR
jgi:outer membrane biosynthesis protein TonB